MPFSKDIENTLMNVATNTAVLFGLNQTGVGEQVTRAFPNGIAGSAMAGSAVIESVKLAKMGLGELGALNKQPRRDLEEVAIDFVAQSAAIYGLETIGFSNRINDFFPAGPLGSAMQGALLVEAVDVVVAFAKEKGLFSKVEQSISSIF